MQVRPTRNQTEIDLLPPFGKPEVITTGDQAADVALIAVVLIILLSFNNR
ncbi:hypothetical protein [Haloferax gibbonsii]|nr:hypothetical protein [Haloferax gibbonsii]